jgi:hypothetical protein
MANPLFAIPGLGGYLAQEQMTNQANAGNLEQAVGMQGLLEKTRQRQELEQVTEALRGAANEEEGIAKLQKLGTPTAFKMMNEIAQVSVNRGKMAEMAKQSAFRDPKNLAQFMTPGTPGIPSPPDELGGGPAMPPTQGRIDPNRLLAGAAAAGVLDPLAYAKEQITENKPQFAPSRSPGYFQNGRWVATPENQPAPPVSPLARLQSERDAILSANPNDPRLRQYDQYIQHLTNPQSQRIIIPPQPSAPVAVIGADGKPTYVERKDAIGKTPATGANVSLMGGRESVFLNRVLTASNQVNRDLTNIVELPVSAGRGLFGGRGQGTSLFEAAKETLTTKMTTQEVQTYNVMATGIQRNLAAIEAAGLAPPNSLMHMMDAVIFKEGDTNFTKIQKLAQTRQVVEAGLETILANPRVSEEQKKHAEDMLAGIRKAVPFTAKEVIKLGSLQQTNPNATLKDVMESEKSNASAAGGGWDQSKEQRYQELLRKQRGGS